MTVTAACAPAPTPTPLPQGKVSVGDHSLYYRCVGSGTPTVVVEAGFGSAGASSRAWDAVAAGVEPETRICVYDRAPLGLSRTDLAVRTANDVARDLHLLLTNARIDGPYVLVAHSYGGVYVRSYVNLYPNEVVGLVFMDAILPDLYQRIVDTLPPRQEGESTYLSAYRQQMAEFWASPDGQNAERLNIPASTEQTMGSGDLGALPLVAITHRGTSGMFSAGLPGELEGQLELMWQEMVLEQAGLSTNGSFVQAAAASHDVQRTEPQLVIDAILKVVEMARERAR